MDDPMKRREAGEETPTRQPAPSARHRKPYTSPALVEYGPVAKLTQGTLSRSGDGPGGGRRNARMMGMA